MATPAPVTRDDPRSRQRRGAYIGVVMTLGFLIAQNALGIFVNLFVSLQVPSNLGAVFPVILSNPVLTAHALTALGLIAGAALLAVTPVAAVGRRFRGVSLLLILDLATTAYLGYHFVGTQDNAYSFGMELGFLVAVVLTIWLWALVGPMTKGNGGYLPLSRVPDPGVA